uniref:Rhodanese-Like Domain Protein n=1 Tax=Florenciella sp. virus SA2 TaxID=3240092 RepID=A0AB39JC06_9VIRU
MSEICASCIDFDINKIVKSNPSMHPKWLSEKNYVKEFIEKTTVFTNKYPSKYNIKMKINVGKLHAGKKILYWGAKEKTNQLTVNDAKTAYGTFSNSGIVTIDKNGFCLLKLVCPQIYKTVAKNKTTPQSYYRHLHFVISDKLKTNWNPQIYTKLVICKFDLKSSMKMLQSGNFVFINALPSQYYGKDHIPNSYNLTSQETKQMTPVELNNWMKDIIKLHYPKIDKAVKDKKLAINEIPIVAYCAHNKCNASEMLIEELMKKGMVNINEFSGGMKEYRKYYL